MSNVDQRIVEMQFDNKQFEQGVSTSLKTLEKLKKGLELEKSARSLEDLQRAGRNFSLDGLAKSVDFIARKFTALGMLGVMEMQRIYNAALRTGEKLLSAITIDPVRSGLREYETQISAIQTILSNTRSKGTTLDDVNAALDELNTYSDKTIYNFTQMAKNIGTFTAAGVDLKTSTAAIKGIANLAAVSGSTAEQASVAMYQLSQALASGTIRLMDWNSVVNAGMGGEVFQKALKDTARIHGVAIDAMIKKEGSFRETLQNGWLTSAILTETLSKFTGDLSKEQILAMGYTETQAKEIIALGKDASDAATKVKTFSQLIDTLKEALGSGWAQTWRNLIGNFEEARTLWTDVSDVLSGLISENAQARNDLLAKWKEAGGRDDLLKGLRESFEALWGVVLAIGEGIRDIFPDTTVENLLTMSKAVKDFGRNLRILFYYSTKYDTGSGGALKSILSGETPSRGLKKGDTSDEVKKLQERLNEAGANLKADGIFGKNTKAALEKFQKEHNLLVDGIFGEKTKKALFGEETSAIQKLTGTITYFGKKLKELQDITGGFFAIVDMGLKVLKFLWDIILVVADTLSPILDLVIAITAAISRWITGLDKSLTVMDPFSKAIETIRNFLKPLKGILENVTKSILNFLGIGDEAQTAAGKMQSFVDVIKTIKEFLFGTKDNIRTGETGQKGLFGKIGDFFNSISEWYSKSEMAQKVVSKIKEAIQLIKDFIFGTEDNVRMGEKGQPNFIQRVSNVLNWIVEWYSKSEMAKKVTEKIKAVIQTIRDFVFGSKDNIRTGEKGQPSIITRVVDLFNAISEWYSKSEVAQKVVAKVKEVIQSIKDFLFGSKDDTRTGEKGQPGVVKWVFDFFESVAEWYSKSEIAKKIVDKVKEIIQTIKNFVFGNQNESLTQPNIIQRVSDFFKSVSEWYSKSEVAQKVVAKLKEVIQTIKDFVFGTRDDATTGERGQPNIIQRVSDFFKSVAEWYSKSEIAQKVVDRLKTVVQSIKDFIFGTKDDTRTGEKGQPNIIQRVSGFFKSISEWYSKSQPAQKMVEKLKKFAKDVWTFIKTFFGGFELGAEAETKAGANTKNPEKTMEPMITFAEGFGSGLDRILTSLDGVFKKVSDFFNEKGIGGIISLIISALSIKSIFSLGKALKNLLIGAASILGTGKTILTGFEGIGKVFTDGFGGLFKAFKEGFTGFVDDWKKPRRQIQPVAKSILEIAAAVALLVAAVYVLGTMKPEQLQQGAIYLGGILVALTLMTFLFSRFTKDAKSAEGFQAVGKSLLSMAFAILILVGVIYLLGTMDSGILTRGSAFLAGMLLVMGVFLKGLQDNGTSKAEYKGLVGMALAIGILVGIIWLLGGMDIGKFAIGFSMLILIMTSLGIFMAIVNSSGSGSEVRYRGLFSMALAIGLLAGIVVLLSKVDWNEGWKGMLALLVLMTALAVFTRIVSRKTASPAKYAGLIAIAVAIGILAAVAVLLGTLDDRTLLKGVGAVTLLMIALGTMMALMGTATKNLNASSIAQTAVILIGFSGLMIAFAYVMQMIKDIDPKTMISFAGSFALAFATLIGAIVLVGSKKVGVGTMAKGAAGIGTAITIFLGFAALLVGGLGAINDATNNGLVDKLNSGGDVLKALGKAISSLVAGIREGILGTTGVDSAAKDLESFNTSLGSLKDSLNGLAWVMGALLFSSFIVGMVGGGKGAGTNKGWLAMIKGAFAISAAIAIFAFSLTLIVTTLGWFNKKSKDEGFVDTITEGGKVLKALGEAMPKFIEGIAEAVLGFTGLDTGTSDLTTLNDKTTAFKDALSKFAGTLGVLLGSSFLIGLVPNGWLGMLGGAAGISGTILLFTTVLTGIVWTLGRLNETSENKGFVNTLKAGAEVLGALGEALGSLIGGIKLGFANYSDTTIYIQNVQNYSDALAAFQTAINGMSESETLDDDILAAEGVAQKIHNFFETLKMYPIDSRALVGYVTAPAQLSSDMLIFSGAIEEFSNSVSNLGNPLSLTLNTLKAIFIASILYGFFSSIDFYTVDRTGINNYNSVAGLLSGDIKVFGEAIDDFRTETAGLASSKDVDADTQKAIDIAKSLKTFFNSIGTYAVMGWGLKWYNASVQFFSADMVTFAQAIKDYGDKINAISKSTIEEDTTAALAVATALRDFLVGINGLQIPGDSGPFWSFFGVDSAGNTILTQMGKLGENMNSIKGSFSGLGDSKIVADTKAAKDALTVLVEFLSWTNSPDLNIPAIGSDGSGAWPVFDRIQALLSRLGDIISEFSTDTATVDTSRMYMIATSIGTLAASFSSMSQTFSSESATNFETSLNNIIGILNGESDKKIDSSKFLEDLDYTDIDTKITEFLTHAEVTLSEGAGSLLDMMDNFNSAGTKVIAATNAGVDEGADTSGVSSMMDAMLSVINNSKAKFGVAGYNLGKGLGTGIEASAVIAAEAARKVAEKVLAKIKLVFAENSPSKATKEIGMYADMGLANGLSQYGRLATKSAANVGNDVLDTTGGILANLSTVLADGTNTDPVIRPVVDLSNVTSGARAINGILSGQQLVSVSAAQSKRLASSVNLTKAGTNQNGTSPLTDKSVDNSKSISFAGATFNFSDKLDIRAWKLELDGLTRDDDRAHGSVF